MLYALLAIWISIVSLPFNCESFNTARKMSSMRDQLVNNASSSRRDVIVLDGDGDDDSSIDVDDDVAFVGTSQPPPAAVGSISVPSQATTARRRGCTTPQLFTPFYLYASRASTTTTSYSYLQTNDGGKSTKYFRTLRQMIGFDNDDMTRRKKRKYQWLAIFNFLVDFSYLTENLMPELLQFHRIIVFYGTNTDQEDEAIMNRWRQLIVGTGSTVEFISLILSDPPRSKTNPLPIKIPYGVHHTKMFLMGYRDETESRDYCRVVVHTANLIQGDIEYKMQGAYCQDFPLKPKTGNRVHQVVNPYKKQRVENQIEGKSSNSGWPFDDEEENCQFEEDLITYLESYRYLTRQTWCTSSSSSSTSPAASTNDGYLSDKPMSWLQLIRQYDYSTAYAILIPSVPGRHRRNVYDNFGYLKLRQAIILSTSPQKQNEKRTTPPAPLICQISSIGSLNVKWLDQFLSAIDSSSTHELDPEHDISSSGKGGKKSVHTDKQRPLSSRLKIVWPTMEEIRTSIEGYSGGGSVPGTIANVSKDFLSPLFHRWSLRRNPGGARIKQMNGNMDPLNTARYVPHIKMIIQPSSTNVDDDDEIDWLVLTSHNLSIAAWGQLQKSSADGNIRIDDEKVLFIRSWELGVFISPATLMAGGHASAGNKLRMHPFRGISDSSPDAIINVDSDDDDDDGGNECKKSNVVLVPIPFDLNPDPYNNDDVAWARDRSCSIPDAFGCIMR